MATYKPFLAYEVKATDPPSADQALWNAFLPKGSPTHENYACEGG